MRFHLQIPFSPWGFNVDLGVREKTQQKKDFNIFFLILQLASTLHASYLEASFAHELYTLNSY